MSPISSRKMVPPLACSNFPCLSLIAPVKDPFTCPKSSDSISSEGIAAQFTSINEALFLWLPSCIHLATNSLPEPFGPVMSTLASDGAICCMVSFTAIICGQSPMMSCKPALEIFLFRDFVSTTRECLSCAFRRVINNLFKSGGLEI